jgi:hypothetical protein
MTSLFALLEIRATDGSEASDAIVQASLTGAGRQDGLRFGLCSLARLLSQV